MKLTLILTGWGSCRRRSEILVRGGRDYASLQPGERQRYDLVVISSLNLMEDAYVGRNLHGLRDEAMAEMHPRKHAVHQFLRMRSLGPPFPAVAPEHLVEVLPDQLLERLLGGFHAGDVTGTPVEARMGGGQGSPRLRLRLRLRVRPESRA